ncbi:MAG: gluconate 2-dehydrogenase subunit 3 family protein [Chloroflexota bacterium]|nr:MAG: gluconate 2-dehydrogenase subunit 3 family protein [Chloroflexota bacterium]
MLPGDEARGFAFFTLAEARVVAAAAARMFPSDDLGPGAPEAGVVFYIDRALAGHDADLAALYRRGVADLDARARAAADCPFARAAPETQDAILAALEAEGSPFFAALLTHTREGMFADPIHGGNRDMVGWKLLGHPGVQMAYGPTDYVPGARIERAPRGLADFLRERGA